MYLVQPTYKMQLHLQEKNYGKGVLPDITTERSLEDILAQRNVELEKAMELIAISKKE